MVSVLSSTPRILIGRSGSNGPFGAVADGLRTKGYPVTEWESSRIGAHSTEQDVRDQVKDIDLAFLVIREKDAHDGGGPIRPLHRILVEAGLMQGKMEIDRVVLLVEDSVDGLSADTGLSSIRFSPGDPDTVLRELLNKIGTVFPDHREQQEEWERFRGEAQPPPPLKATVKEERDLHVRQPMGVQARSDALRVAWLLLLFVLVAALGVILWASRGDEDPAERLSQGQTTSALRTGSTANLPGPSPSVEAETEIEPIETGTTTDSGGEVTIGQTPAAPEATKGAENQLLPATCQLNLRKGLLLDGAIRCDGAGRLSLEGPEGPWHNDLAAVAVSDGVVGQLEYELRDDGTTTGSSVIDLVAGTTVLNETDAVFGVGTIILRFSANNQHVHLFEREDAGGQSATLTFSLDR